MCSRHLPPRWTVVQTVALLVLTVLSIQTVHGARILMVPIAIDSHVRGQVIIGQELASRGHEVHIIYSNIFKLPKDLLDDKSMTMHLYEDASVTGQMSIGDLSDISVKALLEGTESSLGLMIRHSMTTFSTECRRLLENQDELFKRLGQLNFDVAIVDGLFPMKCLFMVPHRLGIPWITLTGTVEPWIVRLPYLTSFVSTNLFDFTERMTFLERLQNTALYFALTYFTRFPGPPEQVLERYRQYGHFDDLNDLASKTSLWIALRHTVLDYAKPSMPNSIDAAGITIKPTDKKLPSDLEAFVQAAEAGAVVFTFGSMVADLPEAIGDKFLEAFRQLNRYRFVWRFGNSRNRTIPGNVWASSWIPQNVLLAHDKVLLFIAHGGYNGLLESVYYAKPMLVFPLFGDQHYNAKCMVHKGFARQMNIHDFTVDELKENIIALTTDPAYKKTTSLASEIIKSDVQTPLEKTAWWVEHIIKFGGEHLRSGGNDLSFFQYWMLDVLLFITVTLIVIVVCVLALCRCVVRRCCRKTASRAKKQKHN